MARRNTAICPEHWPDGWPANAYTAVCEHGEYKRTAPKAQQAPADADEEASDTDEEAAEDAAEEE